MPPLPRGMARCRAETRRYWAALHESGAWNRLDALGHIHAEMLLRLIDGMHQTDSPKLRAQLAQEVARGERELGLRGPPLHPVPQRRPLPPLSPTHQPEGDVFAALT